MPATVAQHCAHRQMTTAELAAAAGLPEQRIDAIVAGRWTPKPEERRKIADALGVAVEDIAWGHTTPVQHLYGHGPG
jgi:DNA-binding XRE family transcriptional regulator